MDNNRMNNGNSDFNQQFYQQPFEQPIYQQPFEQPPYEQSGYPQGDIYAQLGGKKSQTKELLALVFGILTLPFLCCQYLGIGLGIAAIVLAVLSRNDNDGKMPGMALAGLICAVAAIAILVMANTLKTEDIMQFFDALEDFF